VPRSKAAKPAEFDQGANDPRGYLLRLYIAGATPRSARAVSNIRKICEKHLQGRYDLEVVDLYQQPGRAADGQVLAAPTLVKEEPQPPRRMIGDLSDEGRVLVGLGLDAAPAA
jgi:circadian clock protein KaiB